MKTVYCPDCRTFRQSDVLSEKDWSAAARKAGGYPPVPCGCVETPTAPTVKSPSGKGEDIVELTLPGQTPHQIGKAILDAYIGAKLAHDDGRRKGAVSVKAMLLRNCPTPWVCSATWWLGDVGTSTMLPLYRTKEFEAKFPSRKLRLAPDTQDKEGGYYFGVCVRHAGKDYVIGPDAEERKLTAVKVAAAEGSGPKEKPYGWSMKLRMRHGTLLDFHCVASTEKTARRLALRKRGVAEIVDDQLSPYTREEYHRVYGSKRGRP